MHWHFLHANRMDEKTSICYNLISFSYATRQNKTSAYDISLGRLFDSFGEVCTNNTHRKWEIALCVSLTISQNSSAFLAFRIKCKRNEETTNFHFVCYRINWKKEKYDWAEWNGHWCIGMARALVWFMIYAMIAVCYYQINYTHRRTCNWIIEWGLRSNE